MPLVASLLATIVRADGDALVLHAGERPYVVTPSGQAELASRELTLEAMTGMVNELLPVAAQQSLDEDGAVQHRLPATDISAGEEFTVVAAKGGDDIWIEIRRHRKSDVEPPGFEEIVLGVEPEVQQLQPELHLIDPDEIDETDKTDKTDEAPPAEPEIQLITPEVQETQPEFHLIEPDIQPVHPEVEPIETAEAFEIHLEPELELEVEAQRERESEAQPEAQAAVVEQEQEPVVEPHEEMPQPLMMTDAVRSTPRRLTMQPPPVQEPQTAVVLPISRGGGWNDQASRFTQHSQSAGIDRLFRIAAARGASTLYLTSQSKPSIRVDGEISAVEGEPVLSEEEVEAMMLDIIPEGPERNRETLRSQAGTEWICDVPDVGRVRCVTFRDHRGSGGIFRMIPPRAISADRLGLSREIQGLCAEADGLVLITGPRTSGKSTLISSFVDLINRSRSDHVITLENRITFVHENRSSLVSQREVGGDSAELTAAARAALRENPDVLVIEDLNSPEILPVALEAAQSGRLVIGAVAAHTATEALDRIIDQTPPERRPKILRGLAEALRGVVAQVLLRKTGGGRVAAREVLLNSSAVANLIAEGKISQLPAAIESGRKHGMVPLNDALASFVQTGVVDSREAYRLASDQSGFLAQLKRHGVDTSFVERLA